MRMILAIKLRFISYLLTMKTDLILITSGHKLENIISGFLHLKQSENTTS